MTDLLNSPFLKIEQQSSQLDYRIEGENDLPLGHATQVAGPKPRKGLLGMFGSGLKNARVVVQVGGLDGAPLFYVDHQDGAPVAVVAPGGQVIGRFQYDLQGVAQQMAAGGVMGAVFGRAAAMRHRLLDGADRPLCELAWEMRQVGTPGDNTLRWIPVGCDYTDVNGQLIAHADVREATFKDRYVLQLMYQLPEPLRTMVIASPLAFDLTRS
ncbi:hypothetical protein ACFOY4_20300 [Actinomadura syzygii]|uniref:Uncharacterized protein n=1 Tax=Actinomadura syzygii TaxID=1427538 RepID=A0A5D0U662_9ACTN|nr:hypothetical protein [Actinomadura syzygii]TYC12489.1 hypothetical protein FXF65_24935 [Actinomadura syzygii]